MKKKEVKRKEAETRQKQYKALSIKQKREKLDKKLGKGQGAKQERQKFIERVLRVGLYLEN